MWLIFAAGIYVFSCNHTRSLKTLWTYMYDVIATRIVTSESTSLGAALCLEH